MKRSDGKDLKFTSFAERAKEYWKNPNTTAKFPTLSKIAQRILNVPASSSSLERMFSSVGQNLDVQRTRLKAKTILGLVQTKKFEKFQRILKSSVESEQTNAKKRKIESQDGNQKRQKNDQVSPTQSTQPTSSSNSSEDLFEPFNDNVHMFENLAESTPSE